LNALAIKTRATTQTMVNITTPIKTKGHCPNATQCKQTYFFVQFFGKKKKRVPKYFNQYCM
jgi:hypothetical protein